MGLENITMTEGSFIEHEPDEWIPGTLTRIEEAEDFGYGPTIRFVLELDGDDGLETWALASQKMSPRSKLYNWVSGIDPSNVPEVGQRWDYQALEGRRIEVMFEVADGRDKVVKMRAAKRASAVRQASQKASAAKQTLTRAPRTVQNDEEPF